MPHREHLKVIDGAVVDEVSVYQSPLVKGFDPPSVSRLPKDRPSSSPTLFGRKAPAAVLHDFDSLPYSVAKDEICDEIIRQAEVWADASAWTIPF